MKIALVTYAINIGGVETFLRQLADCFIERQHEVTFIETRSRGIAAGWFEEKGYKVKQVTGAWYGSRVRHARQIVDELDGYDYVIITDAPYAMSGLGLLPDETVKVPVVMLNLDVMYRTVTSNPLQSDRIVAISPGLAREAREYLASEYRDKVTIIPLGTIVPDQWPKKEDDFLKDEFLRLVYVGRMSDNQKGIFLLPEIVKRLEEENIQTELHLAGGGPDLDELKNRFAEMRGIHFHGSLNPDQVMELLSGSHILLMPSNFEGFGLVIVEAMARGVIPIATRLTDITDRIVDDGVNGVLVGKKDINGFCQAISKLATSRHDCARISRAAWDCAKKTYSMDVIADHYLDVYKSSVTERSSKRIQHQDAGLVLHLLGDYPYLPIFSVRYIRALARLLGFARN